jgi:hypothetical protein
VNAGGCLAAQKPPIGVHQVYAEEPGHWRAVGTSPLQLVQHDKIIADYLGLKANHEGPRKGMILATLLITDCKHILRLGSCVPDQGPPRTYAETMMAKHFPQAINDRSLHQSHSFQTQCRMTLLNGDQCDLGQWTLVTGGRDKTLPEVTPFSI